MNFRKGQNGYAVAIAFLAVGGIFLVVGYGILSLLPTDSDWRFAVNGTILDGGKISLFFGITSLAFTFPGAFFSFNTDKLIPQFFLAGTLALFSAVVFVVAIAIAGSDITEPWLFNTFTGLGGLGFVLIMSTFFLHAARKPDDEPTFFDRLIARAIRSGKVVVHPSSKVH